MDSLKIQLVDHQLSTQAELEYEGQKVKCRVLIDTGAMFTIFDKSIIDEIDGAYTQKRFIEGIGGTVACDICRFVNVCLVDFEGQRHCWLRDVRVVKKIVKGYNGILGMDILKTMDWSFDEKNELLTLTYNPHRIPV